MQKYFFIFFIFLSLGSQEQVVSGLIQDTDTRKPLEGAIVYLTKFFGKAIPEDTIMEKRNDLVWYGGKYYQINDSIITNSNGIYSFSLKQKDKYYLIAHYKMQALKEFNGYSSYRDGIDSTTVKFKNEQKIKPIFLLVNCPYDKTKDQQFCPKCKKPDKVVPILYGLLVPIIDEFGNVTPLPDKYYPGGCTMDFYCNPTKHCERCDKNF